LADTEHNGESSIGCFVIVTKTINSNKLQIKDIKMNFEVLKVSSFFDQQLERAPIYDAESLMNEM